MKKLAAKAKVYQAKLEDVRAEEAAFEKAVDSLNEALAEETNELSSLNKEIQELKRPAQKGQETRSSL